MLKKSLSALGFVMVLTILGSLAAVCVTYRVIPVPTDILVKVKDIPDNAASYVDGNYIDVGYRFRILGGGEWVGYIDHRHYYQLVEGKASFFLKDAGMDPNTEPPPDPILWMIYKYSIIGCGVVIFLLGGLAKLLGIKPQNRSQSREDEPVATHAPAVSPQHATGPTVERNAQIFGHGSNNSVFGRR